MGVALRAKLAASTLLLAGFVIGDAGAATTYTYDDLGRLTKATYDNGKEIDYSYDPAGNRTQVVTQASPPMAPLAPARHNSKRAKLKKLVSQKVH